MNYKTNIKNIDKTGNSLATNQKLQQQKRERQIQVTKINKE